MAATCHFVARKEKDSIQLGKLSYTIPTDPSRTLRHSLVTNCNHLGDVLCSNLKYVSCMEWDIHVLLQPRLECKLGL